MTEQDFAYWLQGAFEIADVKVLDDVQVECVQRHIALVRVLEPRSVLINQVDVLLTISDPAERTTLIRKVVNDCFAHVIDPKHPKHDDANAAHAGTVSGVPKPTSKRAKPWHINQAPTLMKC